MSDDSGETRRVSDAAGAARGVPPSADGGAPPEPEAGAGRPLRLLVLTPDFPPEVGGIQTYSRELALALGELGHRVTVLAPSRLRGGALADADAAARGPYRLQRLPGSSDDFPFQAFHRLPALTRGEPFDAALATHWGASAAALRCRGRGVGRVAVAAHGRELLLDGLPYPGLRVGYDALRAGLLRRADVCLAVSRFTAALLRGLGVASERIGVVPNGCRPERARGGDGERFRRRHGLGTAPIVLTVCRLVPRKGIDTLVAALPAVRRQVPSAVLAVVGDGPDGDRLRQLAAELGVGDATRFLGRLPEGELADAFAGASVFALPARSDPPDVEGFGLVFLEAGAAGLPVVGARAGGVPDAVVDGETGLLVPPGDASALADALAGLLRDPSRARSLGARGRSRAEGELHWRRVAGRVAWHLAG